jgi:hypothetical protein
MESSKTFDPAGERRIEYLTLGLGAAATLAVAVRWGWRAAAGLALGAVISWVNYRWLKQGVVALARVAATQADAPKVRIPKRVYAKLFGRFALLLALVYVILSGSLLPGATVLAGLFAAVAAVMVEMIYRLVRGTQARSGPAG